jgi:hypothetical protein
MAELRMRSVRHALVVHGAPSQSVAGKRMAGIEMGPSRSKALLSIIFSENRAAVFQIMPSEMHLLDRPYFFQLESDVKPPDTLRRLIFMRFDQHLRNNTQK